MKRHQLATIGAPVGSTSDPCLRLELALIAEDGATTLEQLHDDEQVGCFARVYRGQLTVGTLSIPLAVKVQREQALNQERYQTVEGKFNREHAIHATLRHSPSPHLVGAFDLSPREPGVADELE